MPRTAIVETSTGRILVLDPPTREVPIYEERAVTPDEIARGFPEGAGFMVQIGTRVEVIKPEGVECDVVELDDKEAVKLATPNARFTVSGSVVEVEQVVPSAEEIEAAVLAEQDRVLIVERAKQDPAFSALARALGVAVG